MQAFKHFFPRVTSVFSALLFAAIMPVASQAQLLDGLIAYYPFDGNSYDQSGNGNDGIEYGDIQYESGLSGGSASFDGIDDYIRVPSDPSLNPVDQVSISFWAKVEGFTNLWSPIIHKGGPYLTGWANREYAVWLEDTSSFYMTSAGDGSSQLYVDACCATISYWTHFVGVVDRQNHWMKVYVDGVLKADVYDSYSTFNNNDSDLLIGWTEEDGTGFSPFKGRIDEMRIYDHALSEDEVKTIFNEHAPVGLVAWWPLDGNAVDASGNGNDGQVFGPVPCEDRFSEPSGAMCFDGDPEDLVDIGNGVKPPFPFTMTAWVRPDVVVGNMALIRNDQVSDYYYGASIAVNDLGQISFGYHDGGYAASWNRVNGWTAENVIRPVEWQHVAVVFNAHLDVRLFWNCEEYPVDYWDGSGSGLAYSGANGALGHTANGLYPYDGAMDDVRVYGRSLSSEEIAGLCTDAPKDWFGYSLQTASSYEFSVERYAQVTDSIHLYNPGTEDRTATLQILNPHPEPTVSPQSQEPISVAPKETVTVPLLIDGGGADAGAYDGIQLEITVDDGSTLYSNLRCAPRKCEARGA